MGGIFGLLIGALDSIAQPEGREVDPVADTSVVSIPLYIRRDGAGALVPVRHIRPKITKRTYGLAVHLHGPSEYYLDQVEQWPSGGDVCIYANVRAGGDHSLYVRVDDVHRAVCAALALRQAIVR